MREVLYTLILFAFTSSLSNAQVAKIQYLENLPYDKYELEHGEDNQTFYLSVNPSKQKVDAKEKIQTWQKEYNRFKPHSKLGNLTPDEFEKMHSKKEKKTLILNVQALGTGRKLSI